VRKGRFALVLLGFLAAVVAAAAAGYAAFERWLDRPLALGDTPATIEIPRGRPFSATVDELSTRGVIDHPAWLRAYARATGVDSRIRAGEYEIPPGTTPRTLLRLLESGRVVQHTLTIVEGWTFRTLRRALEQHPQLDNTLAGQDDAAVMGVLGEPDAPPEGLFFPDTYLFGKGTTDVEILRQARGRMRQQLEAAWKVRADGLPIETPYEALVLASIVEKETALAEERPRIAGVFVSRLRRKMLLQTDPTVIYGLGERFDGNLRRRDLESDTPYNTYTLPGLPPTPIALVGPQALRAALNPDVDGSLYFVSRGDGSHHFSRSYDEHRRAVRCYQLDGRCSGVGGGG
jgi:UPF0755 protein